MDCAAFEMLLADAVEDALPPELAAQFTTHAATCDPCRELLERARQGHAWLGLLKQETIEPPSELVAKILARTSDAATIAPSIPQLVSGVNVQPERLTPRLWRRPTLVHLRRTVTDPRLALTAAMAFFSISLTLNLLGVRLTGMKPADLAPQNLRRTMTRQYVQANSRVVRYYENLRFVYEVESRVQELRRAAQTSEPADQPKRKQSKSSGSSSEDSEPHKAPMARTPNTPARQPTIQNHAVQVPLGPLVEAAIHQQRKPFQREEFRVMFRCDAMEKRFHASSPALLAENSAKIMSCAHAPASGVARGYAPERSAV